MKPDMRLADGLLAPQLVGIACGSELVYRVGSGKGITQLLIITCFTIIIIVFSTHTEQLAQSSHDKRLAIAYACGKSSAIWYAIYRTLVAQLGTHANAYTRKIRIRQASFCDINHGLFVREQRGQNSLPVAHASNPLERLSNGTINNLKFLPVFRVPHELCPKTHSVSFTPHRYRRLPSILLCAKYWLWNDSH